ASRGSPLFPYTTLFRSVRWVERNVRLGEGDRFGQPPQVAPFQRALLWKLGELGEDLSRRFRFALISFGKGGGKTPLGGWIGSLRSEEHTLNSSHVKISY